MGVLDSVLDVLRKPRDVFVGGVTGLGNQVGDLINFDVNQSGLQALGLRDKANNEDEDEIRELFAKLDRNGVDASEFEYLRPKAQSALSGIKEGWKGELSPSELYTQGKPVEQWDDDGDLLDRVLKPTFDIATDPLLFAGAAGGAGKLANLPGVAGKVGKGVGTFGPIPRSEGLALGQRAGQAARRYGQGYLATGDPMSAIAAGSLIGGGERAAAYALKRAAGTRLGKFMQGRGDDISETERVLNEETDVLSNYPGPPTQVKKRAAPSPFTQGVEDMAPYPGPPVSQQIGPDELLQLIDQQPKALGRGALEAGPIGSTGMQSDVLQELLEVLKNERVRIRGY